MKRFGMNVYALLCLAGFSLPCIAQANPWNGSWKIDPSTVKFDGATFSVVGDANGFTVTRDGKASPPVVCDGKPGKETNGVVTTCVANGATYELSSTRNGVPSSKTTIAVSEDGKKMTRKGEYFPPNEEPYTMTMAASRVSGGPGPSGVWKETGMDESQDNGILTIEVTGDSVAFKETDSPKPMICKLDGTPTKVDEDSTMSVKLVEPHTLKVTYAIAGKERRMNTFVLSADGRTIKETDVTPAPSASTVSMLFHKQ